MKESLKDVMEKCHADYARTDRVAWALKWPGMVVLAVDPVPLTLTLALTLTLTPDLPYRVNHVEQSTPHPYPSP